MKKLLAIILSVAMIFCFVACGEKKEEGQKEPVTNKPVTIAYIGAVSTAQSSVARIKHINTVCEATGGKCLWVDCERSADSMLNALESAAAQGADAAILVPVADSMIPKVIKICEENEMYFGFLFRYANDPDIAKELQACKWYVGNCLVYSDDAVYASTSQMAELGAKNICLFGQAKGDVDGDARDAAAERAAKEHGMTILNEARALADAADAAKVVENWLSAYPEMDGILITATAVCPGITDAVINALKAHGKEDKVIVAIHDYVDGMAEAFDSKGLNLAYGGDNVIASEFLAAFIANAVQGNPLATEPTTCYVKYAIATSSADCGDYFKYVEGDESPYNVEEAKQYLLKSTNPEVTKDSVLKLADNYTVQEIASRHSK